MARRATGGPLAGLRVLEWARYLPGPYAGLLLADLGAQVTKVEEPGVGDPTRILPPTVQGEGAVFHALNRGKRSVVLDLKRREGAALFRRLVRRADVLLDGHRPGVAKRLGLDWPKLRRVNARLVYCALSGYGHRSPYASRPGHDLNYQALAGAVALTGGREPVLPGVQVGDLMGAWSGVVAVLAALRERDRTRRGAFLDVSLADAAVSAVGLHLARVAGGEALGRPYDLGGGAPFYALYECADGRWLSLGCLEPAFWHNLCDAVPALRAVRDDQFATGADAERVRRELAAAFRERSRDEWVRFLADHDVPAGPVLAPAEVAGDAHVRRRRLVDGVRVASPLPNARRPRRALGPRLGQHTDAVLREAGVGARDLARFRERGVVG